MSDSLLQKLLPPGDPDLVKFLLKEFPDLFDYGDHTKGDGSYRDKRISFCIDKVKNDLIAAKSASFSIPVKNFEILPKLIEVPRQKAIRLSPSPSLGLRINTYLVLPRHAMAPSIRDRLLILPAEFLDSISALGKEYFIIECKSTSVFYRNYAIYKSLMVAANCCYFSNGFLASGMGGHKHLQGGTLDLLPFPQLNTTIAKDLEESGQSLYQEDKKAILGNPSISVKNLCNPKTSSSSYSVLQHIDETIDSLYDSSGCPTGFDPRQWALLKLYAQKTLLLKGLNLL